jgi:hypothetical protein
MLSVGSDNSAHKSRFIKCSKCLVGRGLIPYDLLWPRLDAGISDMETKVVEEVRGTQKNRSSMSCGTLHVFVSQLMDSIQRLHLL